MAFASSGISAMSSSDRMLAYVRVSPPVDVRTCTFVARMPPLSTGSTSSSNASTRSPSSPSRIGSRSAPASINAPSAMSPDIPAMQSK